MGIRGRAASLVNKIAAHGGVKVIRLREDSSMAKVLGNIRERGYSPATIIDIGASNGQWSLTAQKIFRDARFLVIEPLPAHRKRLSGLTRRFGGWFYSDRVCGERVGEMIRFNVSEDLDGSGVAFGAGVSENEGVNLFESTTVDHECDRLKLPYPYLVKLDTHGYELPILEGMKTIWDRIDFLIIEVYNFRLHPECLRFFEMAAYLEKRGFLPFDIAEVLRRPGDNVFWQADMVFGRSSLPEFQRHGY